MTDDDSTLRKKLATAASILRWELADMWGHVSVKTADGKGFLLQHLRPPTGSASSVEQALEFDFEGNVIRGQRSRPDEIFFYTCAYQAQQNIRAVIHCHPPMAVSLIATGQKIIPIHQHSIGFRPSVPVTPWLYGSLQEDGRKAVKLMGDNCAVMIKSHGALTVGESIEEACINMVRLERTAKMILAAAPVGKPAAVSPAAIKKFLSLVGRGSQELPSHEKTSTRSHIMEWNYYESLLANGMLWNRL